MASYISAFCLAIVFTNNCATKKIENVSTTLEQNSNPNFTLTSSANKTPFKLFSLVELSSNSLPVHTRVPRNLRYEKQPRRTQYRHSTRVYTHNKPVPFLLPPEISYVNSGHNYFKSIEDKSLSTKIKTEEPLSSTTLALTTTVTTTTTTSSTTFAPPVPVSQPSVILEPPYVVKEHPVQNIIKKHRNRAHKLRYRGQKRYYSRHQLRLEKKKGEITESTTSTVTVPATTLSQEPVTPEVVTSTTRKYETSETSNPTTITTESLYSPTEEPEFSFTTFYTEIYPESSTQNASLSTDGPLPTQKEENYTSHSDDVASGLLSPEVASMGMKVVATKKGIEMVRRKWFDFDTTTALDYETDTRDSNDVPNDNLRLSVAETGDYRTKLLSNFRQHTETQNSVEHVIPGVAGVDYPTYNKPPANTSKPCSSGVGYVADINSGCQVFYICIGNGVGEPLLCPNGTLFSQDFLVCDWWYNVECHG